MVKTSQRLKLFGRTGGHWLFYISAAYFVIGMVSLYNGVTNDWLSLLYVLFLAMPFWFPPLGRSINLDVKWDLKMFDWFKRPDYSNVVQFPKPEAVPNNPYIEPPAEPEKPAVTFYRLGMTNNNRVSFSMGYSEITLNAAGVDNMIKQLEVFRDQLQEEDE